MECDYCGAIGVMLYQIDPEDPYWYCDDCMATAADEYDIT